MLLSDIREYLKTQLKNIPQWYLNKSGREEKSITIYNTRGLAPRVVIGSNSSYSTKAISLLVRWGKKSNEAEKKAIEVYNTLLYSTIIGSKRVIKVDLKTDEPVYVGTDSEGIIEYVIEVIIYYER